MAAALEGGAKLVSLCTVCALLGFAAFALLVKAGKVSGSYTCCSLGKSLPCLYTATDGCEEVENGGGTSSFGTRERYLIHLLPEASAADVHRICRTSARMYFGTCLMRYTKVIRGMTMFISRESLIALVKAEAPIIDFLEKDGSARITEITNPQSAVIGISDFYERKEGSLQIPEVDLTNEERLGEWIGRLAAIQVDEESP